MLKFFNKQDTLFALEMKRLFQIVTATLPLTFRQKQYFPLRPCTFALLFAYR